MSDPFEVRVAAACVRVAGDGTGTGFFVAPGHVLGCAHVVGRERRPGDEATITRTDGTSATATVVALDPAADVALLHTAARDDDVPVLLDDTDVVLGDMLLLHGYPDGVPTTRTCWYEGGEGAPGAERRTHVLKGGQVLGGFSGGPAVDLRTGAAIGMVQETRDRRMDLGGHAAPVARLCRHLAPLAALLDATRRDDAVVRGWRQALDARARRVDAVLADSVGRSLAGAGAIANFLADHRGTGRAPVPFGGRHRELLALTSWLEAPAEPPYLLLSAPAGRGKSTLLVRWLEALASPGATARPWRVVFVPISIRYQLNTEADVLRALAQRLARARGEPLASSDGDVRGLRDAIAEMLARDPPDGTALLVVVDALDEAAAWEPGADLLPREPSPLVRVVLSARERADRDARGWLAALGLDRPGLGRAFPLGKLTPEAIGDLLRHTTRQDTRLIDALYEASDGGDPLLLRLHVEQLAHDPSWVERLLAPDGARGVAPDGLARFFDGWWRDQERAWGGPLAHLGPRTRLAFDLLALAFGPLGRAGLLALARARDPDVDGDGLDAALAALARFVLHDARTDSYVLAHPRFAEYRYDKLERDGAATRLESLFVDWGRTTLDAGDAAAVDPYLVRYWGAHLDRAGAPTALFLRLLSPAWRRAWDAAGEDESGYAADLRRVLARSWAEVSAGGAAPRPSVAPAWIAAFSLATRRSRLARLHPLVATPLLEHRLWTPRRALSLMAATEEPVARARGLAALIPRLPDELLDDAEHLLARTDTYDQYHVAPAWAALAARFAARDGLDAALASARGRPHGLARAAMLLAAAEPLADRAARRRLVVEAAREQRHMNAIDHPELLPRLRAMRAPAAAPDDVDCIVPGLDDASRREALAATLRACDCPADTPLDALVRRDRGQLLAFVLPWATRADVVALLDAFLAALAAGAVDPLGDEVLRDLAPYLDADRIPAALEALDAGTRSRTGRDERDHVLAALAPAMRGEQRAACAATLASFARLLAPSGHLPTRRASLRRLAEIGHAAAILEATGRLRLHSYEVEGIVETVAPFLSRAETWHGLETVGPGHGDAAVGALLAHLATFGPAEARAALDAADRVHGDLLWRCAGTGLAFRAAPGGHRGELTPDLLGAVAVPPSDRRRIALRLLAMAPFELDTDLCELLADAAARSDFGQRPDAQPGRELDDEAAAWIAARLDRDAARTAGLSGVLPRGGRLALVRRLADLGEHETAEAVAEFPARRRLVPVLLALRRLSPAARAHALAVAELQDDTVDGCEILAAMVAHGEEDRFQAAWRTMLDEGVSAAFLHLRAWRIRALLAGLPGDTAAAAAHELFARAGEAATHLRPDTFAALARFMPAAVLARQNLDRLGGSTSTDRSRVRAAAGARLAALGRADEGLALLLDAPYRNETIPFAAEAIAEVAPADLPAWADAILGLLAGWDGEDRALEPLATRWDALPDAIVLRVVDAWLQRMPRRATAEIFAQLPNFVGGLERLGGTAAIAEMSAAV